MCISNKASLLERKHVHNLICTAGLQRPHLIGNVLHVGSLKRPKHVVHDEQWGIPLMTSTYMKYSVLGDSQMYLRSVQMRVLSMPHTNMDKVPPNPLSFDSC